LKNWPESGEIQQTLFSDAMLLAKELFSDKFRLAEIKKIIIIKNK
jgi:hypothetical protein